MLSDLPSLTETVRRHGLRAHKSLGQHFLLDRNITDKIASFCDLPARVLEVGPGPGGLTRSLIAAGATEVVAIEADERFLPALDELSDATGALRVVHGDALKVGAARHVEAPYVIASNLPYNVGTKLLLDWLAQEPRPWTQMVLMFQLEVAQRVTAEVGTAAYGRLAVLAQSVCEVDLRMYVPARAFSPPPKVDSAVVVCRPLAEPYADLAALAKVTAAAFGQRRKMLRAALKSYAKSNGLDATDWLEGAGLDPTARAETVPVEGFHRLVDSLPG